MLSDETLTSRILDTVAGSFLFLVIVAGLTYYIQSSLIIFKSYDAYTHWTVVLIAVPLIAGLALRFSRLIYPLFTTIIGALASGLVLYPLYKGFWAEPPTIGDFFIYVVVIMGIAYIATQPLRTTFMIAFRLGRYSVPNFTSNLRSTNNKKGKKKVRKTSMTKTQKLMSNEHGSTIALMELIIGLSSLALSVFSVFFLGKS